MQIPCKRVPKSESIDIMLALDISGSMQEPMAKTSKGPVKKVDALKTIVGDFIDKRPYDRFGCIGFFEKTHLLSPLTLDHEFVKGITGSRYQDIVAVTSKRVLPGKKIV